jgi:hypothetical protein
VISLKRLEAMHRWLQAGGAYHEDHTLWAFNAGLLKPAPWASSSFPLVPTKRLASAIVTAEFEHARHKTVERREKARREADYRYLLHRAERSLAAKERP